MKTLKQHINESLKIGKNLSEWSSYSCQPKTKDELIEIINKRIIKEGTECNLNDIDVSLIEDMSYLFRESKFNGDISRWNTSNAINMRYMFAESDFNGDISKWDVSNVNSMVSMFADSQFNGDISKWNTSKVETMDSMFARSKFNQDISNWDVSSVNNMCMMFYKSKFNQDISNWKINKDCKTWFMFDIKCLIKDEYKPKLPK